MAKTNDRPNFITKGIQQLSSMGVKGYIINL